MTEVMSDGGRPEFIVEKKRDITVLLNNVPVNEDIILLLKERVRRDNEVTDRCFQILTMQKLSMSQKRIYLA